MVPREKSRETKHVPITNCVTTNIKAPEGCRLFQTLLIKNFTRKRAGSIFRQRYAEEARQGSVKVILEKPRVLTLSQRSLHVIKKYGLGMLKEKLYTLSLRKLRDLVALL